jgi:spore coat protein U-like protein
MKRRARREVARSLLAVGVLTVCLDVAAVPMCSVASGAAIAFGNLPALASTGDVAANSGQSFWINCTSEVVAAPSIHSSTPRSLQGPGEPIAFGLSAVAPGGIDLPAASPGSALTAARNGSNQTVTLHARIRAADFATRPSGSYARQVVLTVEY